MTVPQILSVSCMYMVSHDQIALQIHLHIDLNSDVFSVHLPVRKVVPKRVVDRGVV